MTGLELVGGVVAVLVVIVIMGGRPSWPSYYRQSPTRCTDQPSRRRTDTSGR